MNSLYRFSPIANENKFNVTIEYIVQQLEQLSMHFFNEKLPIKTVKVFAHYQEEYAYLLDFIKRLGDPAPFNSETSYYSHTSKDILGYRIDFVGVRGIDPYRLHVGCGDYEIENFENFKNKYAHKNDFVRTFREEMLEIWHPDYDVLGYILASTKS